jgi:ferredoxin
MEVRADRDRCIGAGNCVLAAPTVFGQSEDDGTVDVLDTTPSAAHHEAVQRAVALCPAEALSLDPGGRPS